MKIIKSIKELELFLNANSDINLSNGVQGLLLDKYFISIDLLRTNSFFNRLLLPSIINSINSFDLQYIFKTPIQILNEFLQKNKTFKHNILYSVTLNQRHIAEYVVYSQLGTFTSGKIQGKTKTDAKQAAAAEVLQKLILQYPNLF